MKNLQKIIASLIGALLLSMAIASFWAFGQIEEATKQRKNSYSLIVRADAILSELLNAETGERGYLLTDDKTYLEPYLAVRDSIAFHVKELRLRTITQASRKHLDALEPLINTKLAELAKYIDLRHSQNMNTVLAALKSGHGKHLMDLIRIEINGLNRIEQEALFNFEAAFQVKMHFLFVLIIIVSIGMLLLALSFVYLINRETKQRLQNVVHLKTRELLEVQENLNRQLLETNGALHISEERLAVLLNSIGDAVMATDNQGNITLLNPVAELLTGWKQSEAKGHPVDEVFCIINEETRKPATIPVRETLTRGIVKGLANHTVLIARSGSETAIADSCAPIRNRAGLVVGAVLVFRDVTELRRVGLELESDNSELKRVVQVQKVVITDTKASLHQETEGRLFEEGEVSHRQEALEVVYAMETAFDSNIESLFDQIVLSISATLRTPLVAIYEYKDGKIIRGSQRLDTTVSRLKSPAQPCAACKAVLDDKRLRQIRGGLGKVLEGKLCFDALRFHSYLGAPINGPQGEILGIINVLDDTEREFSDSEIKFVETIARYIAHELSRRSLESRIRRGEEMRLLGQLTSGVAHEVRNPLNGILAIMGALSKELSDEERFVPYLQHMRNQVTRLTALMEDLLALGRPLREESGLEISMATLVENAITTWLQTCQVSKPVVKFIKPPSTDLCLVRVDSAYMTQIIINLLENAHNHSPAGAEIICSVSIEGDATVIFTVKDGGTGILEEILPKIFDPFFTTRRGGTGLGLSIVKNIVEKHQGSVTAFNNSDGPGATFEVVLPLFVNQR